MNLIPGILSLVTKHWKYCLIAGLLMALYVTTNLLNVTRHERDAEHAAHELTVQKYRAAADKAKAADLANVIRVQNERRLSDERAIHDLETRRLTAATRYDRLRKQAETYRSDPANANLSASMDATCIAFSGASCDEIPARLKAAQDNTDQLIALQDAVKGQGEVSQ